jgi:uncharacterized membrane protein
MNPMKVNYLMHLGWVPIHRWAAKFMGEQDARAPYFRTEITNSTRAQP